MNEEKRKQDQVELTLFKDRLTADLKTFRKRRVEFFIENQAYFREMDPHQRLSQVLDRCLLKKVEVDSIKYRNSYQFFPKDDDLHDLLEICRVCFPEFHIAYETPSDYTPMITLRPKEEVAEQFRDQIADLIRQKSAIDRILSKLQKQSNELK